MTGHMSAFTNFILSSFRIPLFFKIVSSSMIALRVHKFKCLGKLSNGWTDWHRIWYTSADSSGNRHRLNTIRPQYPTGYFGGWVGLRGHKFKCLGKLYLHQLWVMSADSSGNEHRLNPSRPSIPQGAFRGGGGGVGGHTQIQKSRGSCQTAAPIGTIFGTCRRIRLANKNIG